MSAPVPELSAVVPVYNEEETLGELHRRLAGVLDGLGVEYEILLVNDGSRDRTSEILDTLAREQPRVRAIHFSRNFGHQAAVSAGLVYARGRALVVLDADLQDPPELIGRMLEAWRAGNQVVYARRTVRRGESPVKRLFAWGFYRTLRLLSDVEVPTDTGDFCLMDRAVVDQLNAMPERSRFLRGLRSWVGFRQLSIPYDRPERFTGDVKYTFRKSLALAVSGVLSLSKAPLRLATWIGLLISGASFVLAVWFIYQKLTVGYETRGWASITVIVLFLGGVQLLTIGVAGEYIGRIYEEVKQRPLFIVSRTTGFDDPASTP